MIYKHDENALYSFALSLIEPLLCPRPPSPVCLSFVCASHHLPRACISLLAALKSSLLPTSLSFQAPGSCHAALYLGSFSKDRLPDNTRRFLPLSRYTYTHTHTHTHTHSILLTNFWLLLSHAHIHQAHLLAAIFRRRTRLVLCPHLHDAFYLFGRCWSHP